MEERILDEDENRRIKLKRTAEGTDAVDALAEGEDTEEEVYVDLPEEEYDDDLVGLTPSQLKEELEKRARAQRAAREESEKLAAQGEEKLGAGAFADAELLFSQALVCDFGNDRAREGLWTSRTKNFTDDEIFFRDGVAEELAADETARLFVLPHVEENLKTLRDIYASEEAELAPTVQEKQQERREAFAANRKYYLLRFSVFFVLAVLFAIGIAVSASFILRTQTNIPLILIGVFGGLCLVALAVAFVFARKLFVASRLCGANEKLSSTESGARLEFLQKRLTAIDLVLGISTDGENEEE